MNIRERSEALEERILAPYAAKSRLARREQAMEEDDYRTKFQRDRDRILHAKCFRRLKHKTQVYITSGDHYRTRMTHSLEVAQISRTIARGLQLNEDLIEAIALGHDVGHTPFGHSGEKVVSDLIGHPFHHNEQSLRVVKYLERGGQGLNLTQETMDGIEHHSGPIPPKTLEGQIVHTADRIAYLSHDYDDSLRAGLLHDGDLPQRVYNVLGRTTSEMITTMVADMITASAEQPKIHQSPEVAEAMDMFRTFMFENIYQSDILAHERDQAVFVLKSLFQYFGDHFESLPEEFVAREERWSREQVLVDYIAGLTDSYALQLFEKIFLPPLWSLPKDPILRKSS